MNEKFFDLKPEKQDRMINAALKLFAENGYKRASTDDIVREAGISKGLLFHYFGSKLGLYSFLYEYAVRYVKMEIRTAVSEEEKDYFELMKQQQTAYMMLGRKYPYMQMFIVCSMTETDQDAISIVEEERSDLQNLYDGILEQVDVSRFPEELELSKLHGMIQYTIKGLMNEEVLVGNLNAERLGKEILEYLEMAKLLAYGTATE